MNWNGLQAGRSNGFTAGVQLRPHGPFSRPLQYVQAKDMIQVSQELAEHLSYAVAYSPLPSTSYAGGRLCLEQAAGSASMPCGVYTVSQRSSLDACVQAALAASFYSIFSRLSMQDDDMHAGVDHKMFKNKQVNRYTPAHGCSTALCCWDRPTLLQLNQAGGMYCFVHGESRGYTYKHT